MGVNRFCRIIAGLVFASLLTNASSAGQQGTMAWFGLPLPEDRALARAQMYASTWVDLGFQPLSLRLPVSEDPYLDLNGESIFRTMEEIVAFSVGSRDAGEALWGRIAGMPAERETAEFVAGKFREAGLKEVRIDRFPRNAQWWPTEWELRLVGDWAFGEGTSDYVFTTAFPASPSLSLPDTGLEAELIYVGLGRAEDLAGRDLTGKIAVLNSILDSSAWSHSGRGIPARLVARGAVGVITLIDVQTNHQFMGAGAGARGAPCFVVSGDDGFFLRDVIGKAGDVPLKIRMKLDTTEKEGLNSRNTLGLIPGSGDEYVVLTAHMDAYFQGAQDNATGVATLIHLAEHYGREGAPVPKRNMLFIATGGHHARSRDGQTGSVGAANVRDTYPEVMRNTAFLLNVEHTAAILTRLRMGVLMNVNTERARVLAVTNRSPLLIGLLGEAFDRYGVVATRRSNHVPSGDAGGYARAGITVINFIESGLWYHSTGDTPETIPPEGLARTARAFAHFLDAVDGHSLTEINAAK